MKRRFLLLLVVIVLGRSAGRAAENASKDVEIAAGRNFAVAAFRYWAPPIGTALQGVLVLVPGSNGDGRAHVNDVRWQEFARRHGFALVGCCFKDHPHDNMAIEEYARVGEGSGQALLDALAQFATSANRPELATAPLLLWGHSAGGEFNYEFACWKPDRVLAFVVNKGGYYFTHLAPRATRELPGIFFIGAKDKEFRNKSIEGIFALNRQAGAVWTLVIEPEAGHELGKTPQLAFDFFEEVLARRPPGADARREPPSTMPSPASAGKAGE